MSQNKPVSLTKDNFDMIVSYSKEPVLVDFWAPWCGPCKMVGPIIEDLASEYADSAKICKVNVDTEGELAHKFGVMSIPTLIIFKNGQIIDKAVGARPKEEIVKMLNAQI